MDPGSGASLIIVVDAQPIALSPSQRQPSSLPSGAAMVTFNFGDGACPCGIAPLLETATNKQKAVCVQFMYNYKR